MQSFDSPYLLIDIPEEELTYVGFTWELEGDNLEKAIRQVYSEICRRNGWTLVWDFQAVAKLVLSPGDVDRFVDIVQEEIREGCEPSKVILVTHDLMIRALARLYQHLSVQHNHPVVLCATLKDAADHVSVNDFQHVIRNRIYT